MAAVDYEAAWLALKSRTAGRQGIGRASLLAMMGDLEVEHAYDEANVERLLRQAAPALGRQLRLRAEDPQEDRPSPDGAAAPAERTDPAPDHRQSLGGHDGRKHRAGPRAA